jgi:hypothetical protein
MKFWVMFLLAGVMADSIADVSNAYGPVSRNHSRVDEDEKPWQEMEVDPSTFPRQENLVEFYVSAVATNTYFIDASTLTVGNDEVVRYVLVVKASGGATNVSFEGMRCKDLTWKHYATGSSGGTWTKSRAARNEWRPIENKPVNGYHAALSRNLFCPVGNAIRSADEGRNALRLGKHPSAN